jgi:hypothetical protein
MAATELMIRLWAMYSAIEEHHEEGSLDVAV